MSADEYDDPERLASWLDEQRRVILAYLERQGARHGGLPSDPSWFVAPYLSLWAVKSGARAGAIGWWAVAGDLPTDYLSSLDARDVRSAIRAFGNRWASAAASMSRGEQPSGFTIGEPSTWPKLAPILASRAEILEKWASDDELWS
jgi:hypothetical protein